MEGGTATVGAPGLGAAAGGAAGTAAALVTGAPVDAPNASAPSATDARASTDANPARLRLAIPKREQAFSIGTVLYDSSGRAERHLSKWPKLNVTNEEKGSFSLDRRGPPPAAYHALSRARRQGARGPAKERERARVEASQHEHAH